MDAQMSSKTERQRSQKTQQQYGKQQNTQEQCLPRHAPFLGPFLRSRVGSFNAFTTNEDAEGTTSTCSKQNKHNRRECCLSTSHSECQGVQMLDG
jgi:hypothetical protein